MSRKEPSYWAQSHWENQFASMLRVCWDLGRIAHKADSLLQDFHQAVDILGDVSPSEVKKALKEWKPNGVKEKNHSSNPLGKYNAERQVTIQKIRAKLSFITDQAEKLGLLAKPRRTRQEAHGLVRKPDTNRQ